MFVCICRGVNEKKLRGVVAEENVSSLQELQARCTIGDCCGTCHDEINQILNNPVRSEDGPGSMACYTQASAR